MKNIRVLHPLTASQGTELFFFEQVTEEAYYTNHIIFCNYINSSNNYKSNSDIIQSAFPLSSVLFYTINNARIKYSSVILKEAGDNL
jgi:hypothetical protein